MKLNNKGMSIIEVVVTFALIMFMVLGLFTIVLNYQSKASDTIKKNDLITFKTSITKDIQDDIQKFGIKEITNGEGECVNLLDDSLSECINIVFQDGSQKAFGISLIDSDDVETIKSKFLYYDGIKYKLKDVLPDVIPEGRNITDFQSIVISEGPILSVDSDVLDDGTAVKLYSIDVYISYLDFKEDFGIHITATDRDISKVVKEDKEIILPDLPSISTYTLNDIILNDNTILTISDVRNISPSGLYKSLATNSGDATYYFRGIVDNNYLDFAGFTWRIVRINEDGTIRIILATGINNNATYNYISSDTISEGKNEYSMAYYSNSYVKTVLEEWYSTNIANNSEYSSKVAIGDYFCEAYDYSRSSTTYKPNFVCTTDSEEHGVVNSSVGLITFDETVFAGNVYRYIYSMLDDGSNSHYLYNGSGLYFWTMTPAGISTLTNEYLVWGTKARNSDILDDISVSNTLILRPVINLNADLIYASGNGTSNNPYKIN